LPLDVERRKNPKDFFMKGLFLNIIHSILSKVSVGRAKRTLVDIEPTALETLF
jgi:hypothetical protein